MKRNKNKGAFASLIGITVFAAVIGFALTGYATPPPIRPALSQTVINI
jgi:hypothetical protein